MRCDPRTQDPWDSRTAGTTNEYAGPRGLQGLLVKEYQIMNMAGPPGPQYYIVDPCNLGTQMNGGNPGTSSVPGTTTD